MHVSCTRDLGPLTYSWNDIDIPVAVQRQRIDKYDGEGSEVVLSQPLSTRNSKLVRNTILFRISIYLQGKQYFEPTLKPGTLYFANLVTQSWIYLGISAPSACLKAIVRSGTDSMSPAV